LTLFKSDLFWADWRSATIERANKNDGSSRQIVQSHVDNLMDIVVVHPATPRNDTNACARNLASDAAGGGCAHLCLMANGQPQCACPSHFTAVNAGKACAPPNKFLLFGQKNKISRLIPDHPTDVPDVVLPLYGARDVTAMAYDSAQR
jgi:hypothetical protein